MGTEVADTEAAEIKDTAAPEPTAETIEREAEETIEEGSMAVEDEESSASVEDEISEDDEEEKEEEEKEEEEDPERLSELEILPGKTAYINFYYTIDPEIEGMKDQKVDFSFAYTLEDEEGKQTKNTLRETFRYAVDALNLMTVTAGGEKGYVETGKEDEMLLEFDLGLMREVLEEAIEEELEKTENGDASAAEAKRASASELLVGWEDENGERPLGKKDPAVIKNLKCEVETFGVKLDKFKAVPVKDDDNFGTSLKCSFYVSRKTLPGTYYGRVNASYKIKGKSFHTTQGFKVMVKQETGEMELVGKIGDSEIVMTGPVSSFPKADELSLKVSEITQEQQEKVDEALQKKAEEEGTEISQYKALDIKLMADGVETEPEGDVQVRFKNVNLEKVDENKEAEQEKVEEQSIVKKAVRKVMSLFSARSEEEDVAAVAETGTEVEEETKEKDAENVKAEGSEDAAGETGDTAENSQNIKVLHLDEDAVVANEMKSEVQDNGDVVMDTDHFSIYIVVNVPASDGEVKVRIKHLADIKKWEMVDSAGNRAAMGEDGKYYYYGDNNQLNKENPVNLEKTKLSVREVPKASPTKEIELGTGTYNVHELYPGATYPEASYEEAYESQECAIYSEDTLTLQNGTGTGINYALILENWSKVSSKGNYNVYQVDIKNETAKNEQLKNGYSITEDGTDQKVNLEAGLNEITIRYKPTESEVREPVAFHDYNVTIKTDNGYKRRGVGFNNPSLNGGNEEKNKRRIGIGIATINNNSNADINTYLAHHTSGDNAVYSYNNSGELEKTKDQNGNITNVRPKYGIPKDRISKETRAFELNDLPDLSEATPKNDDLKEGAVFDPGLFTPGDITITEAKGNYYAKQYIDQYKLGFWRSGDNYILSAVYDENGNCTTAFPLNKLISTTKNKVADKLMYSNLFWPLDDTSILKGIAGISRDPMFGKPVPEGNGNDGKHDLAGNASNDEYGIAGYTSNVPAHNWFFGMKYEVEFSIGEYIGPMNYYFRGDDDFYLYIDGILVKDVELGGTHKALPTFVDLKEWMLKSEGINKDENGNLYPNEKHIMTVFFMERGGAGSCCYMAFTLPNMQVITPDAPPDSALMSKTVEKNWLEPEGSTSRPQNILVQLYQMHTNENGKIIRQPYGTPVPLNKENNWSYTWPELSRYVDFNSNKEYSYEVREISTPTDYDENPSYQEVGERQESDDGKLVILPTTVITNIQKKNISVEKIWEDSNDTTARPSDIQVQLYRKLDESKKIIPNANTPGETNGIIDTNLNSSGEGSMVEVPDGTWESIGDPITLNESNNHWQYTWGDLPLFEKVNEYWYQYKYSVQELSGDWLISEANPNGKYEVTYDGNILNGFKITNKLKYDARVELDLLKKFTGLKPNEEGKFNFTVKEVKQQLDGTWTEISELPGTSLLVKNTTEDNGDAEGQGKIVIGYKKDATPGLHYYEIRELKEMNDRPATNADNIIFDETYYRVEINVVKDANGKLNANLSSMIRIRNGKEEVLDSNKESSLLFINRKKTDLVINKIVDTNSGFQPNKKFDFTVTISGTDIPLPKPSADAVYIVNDDGIISFQLEPNGSTITIPVPVGSTVTIKENESSHAGYYVKFKVNGQETDGDMVEIPNIASDGSTSVNVTCTNTPGAILPDTGGPGLLMMSRLGWMLLLLALLMAGMEIQFYGERRNRRAAAVQREDTRGFDPDDY